MKKRFARIWASAILGAVAVAVGVAAEPSPLKRRGEFRRAIESGDAILLARQRLGDPDCVIRRAAAFTLYDKLGGEAFAELKALGDDPDGQVRLIVVNCAADAKTPESQAYLKRKAADDSETRVRLQASKAVWPFHRNVLLLKDDPTWDHEIVVLQSIEVPDKGWRFALDRQGDGHQKRFFAAGFNDSDWRPIGQGYWENQGVPDYDGLAWYRIRFDLPPKPECHAVEIQFSGVDESAWVWLNGVYLGAHDAGPEGHKFPFRLSATREVVWAGNNVLTVRVLDTRQGGGIHGAIRVEILK